MLILYTERVVFVQFCVILPLMKENGKIAHKYSEARNWVRSALLLLPPGGALPGLREMVKLTGIGRTILERVLAEAEANNYIRRRPRSGYYRTEPDNCTSAELAILLDNSNGQLDPVGSSPQKASYISRVILRLQELAAENRKNLFITDDPEELPPDVPLFLAGAVSRDLLPQVQKKSLRAVAISGSRSSALQVMPPKERNVRSGLEYLHKLGHKRIALFFNRIGEESDEYDNNGYLFEYYKFMAEHGIKSYPHFLLALGSEDEIVEQLLAALRHELKPDSLIVPYCWLPTVYRVLEEEKVLVPWHISILATGTPADEIYSKYSPATLWDHPQSVADKAWELMFSENSRAFIRLEPQIIPGKSIQRRN